MAIRLMDPCHSPTGKGCSFLEDPAHLKLYETRGMRLLCVLRTVLWWESLSHFVNCLMPLQMIIGGSNEDEPFYNRHPANTIEFFPSKNGGVARFSPFLKDTVPANLFPR
jgi:hypothetical protein